MVAGNRGGREGTSNKFRHGRGDRGGREGRRYIHKFLTFLLVEISRSLLLIPGYRRAILIPSMNNLEVHK